MSKKVAVFNHTHLQTITTSNCSAIANPHNLQFTTARTEISQSAVSSSVSCASVSTFIIKFLSSDADSRLISSLHSDCLDSQIGGQLTPISYSSHCRLETKLIPRHLCPDSDTGSHLTPISCSSDCLLETQLIPRHLLSWLPDWRPSHTYLLHFWLQSRDSTHP
jgi:hypothetical protein